MSDTLATRSLAVPRADQLQEGHSANSKNIWSTKSTRKAKFDRIQLNSWNVRYRLMVYHYWAMGALSPGLGWFDPIGTL